MIAKAGKQRNNPTKITQILGKVIGSVIKQEGQDGPVSWLPDKFQVNWPFGSREERSSI